MNIRSNLFVILNRVNRAASEAGAMICYCVIGFMIFSTISDAFSRYVLNYPLPGVIEYNAMLMAVLAFMGLSKTQAMKGHISVTFLTDRLKGKWKIKMAIFNSVLALLFMALMAYQTFEAAMFAYSIKEYYWGVIGQTIYIWWAKFAMPIGLGVLCLSYIAEITNLVVEHARVSPQNEIQIELQAKQFSNKRGVKI